MVAAAGADVVVAAGAAVVVAAGAAVVVAYRGQTFINDGLFYERATTTLSPDP